MGVLAVVADDWTIEERPTDVYVGTPRGVKRCLSDQPPILTQRDVIEIAAAIVKPSTWRAPT
jgi:hypothetical protein